MAIDRIPPASPETRAELRRRSEEPMTAEEFERLANLPLAPDVVEEVCAQVEWFRRRYPTGAARSAYIRRVWRRLHRDG